MLPIIASRRDEMPVVVHVDGTARPRLVTCEANPRYYRLIREFDRLTNVLVLLNTSFNVQEPIVCTTAYAVQTCMRTDFGCLVLENLLVDRHDREYDSE